MSPLAAVAAVAARHREGPPPETPVQKMSDAAGQTCARRSGVGWCGRLRRFSSPLLGSAIILFLLSGFLSNPGGSTREAERRTATPLPLLSGASALPWPPLSVWPSASPGTSRNGDEELDKVRSTVSSWWSVVTQAATGEKPTEAVESLETERRVSEVPPTPAGFYFFPDSGDKTGKINCSVEPANFPADARDFVVQCPSSVQTASLLLLTKKENRKFRIPGSSMSTSTMPLHFAAAAEDAREVSLEICDEDADATLSLTSLSIPVSSLFSLFSVFGPSNTSMSSKARAESLTPFLAPPSPIAAAADCRRVSIFPVHLPGQGLAVPRLAQLAVSRGVPGVPSLQPPFNSEILEYHATLPEAQSVTVAAVAAPGFFLTAAEEGGSVPARDDAKATDPLALSAQERKSSLLHKVTCGEPGTAIQLVLSVFSSVSGSARLCSGNAKCVLNDLVQKTLNGMKLFGNSSDPVHYRVYIHCVAPHAGRAALAGIQPTRGQLLPRVFSPEKHLYYLRLPAGANGDNVTFRAADTQTEIVVGEAGRKRSTGVAKNVPLWLPPNEESRVVPIRSFVKKSGGRGEEDGEMYFVILVRATEGQASAADGIQPLLKNLNLLGATLNPPFDSNVFHFSAQVPVDRKFVGLQLGEAVPGSHIHVDGNLFLPRHQTAFYRLGPGDTRRISIVLSSPDSETSFPSETDGAALGVAQNGASEKQSKREVVYTIEVTRPTAWFSGASLVPALADAACWGSGIVHAFAGAGWLAIAKTLNFVAITAAIPGTPEMWAGFSRRFFDFGLQVTLPSSWVEVVDDSAQGRAGPQLLPSASSPLGRLIPATLLGSELVSPSPLLPASLSSPSILAQVPLTFVRPSVPLQSAAAVHPPASASASEMRLRRLSAFSSSFISLSSTDPLLASEVVAPVEGSSAEQKSWEEVSEHLLRYLEIQSDRSDMLGRFASCVLLYASLLLVSVFLFALVIARRIFERRHQAALEAFSAASPAEGLQDDGPTERPQQPTKGVWRFLPDKFAVPSSVLIFLFDYGLISFAQASAGLAFAEKTLSLRIFGVHFSPWCLFTICSALLVVYPIGYLVWAHSTLRFLKKKVVFCSALQKYTDRRVYEVKARISRFSFLPPFLAELCSGELRSVAPIKAPCVSAAAGLAVPLEAAEADEETEDESGDYHRSFSCGGGMALTGDLLAKGQERALSSFSSSCEELSASCAHHHASFCSALLPPCLRGPEGDAQRPEGAEAGGFPEPEEVGERPGRCLIIREELGDQRGAAGNGENEVLLQLDGEAYEVHGYEAANAILCRKWSQASVGRVSVSISRSGTALGASSRASVLNAEAEIQLGHLSSLAWLSAGLGKPLHFWAPTRNLQLSYADRYALLLPPSASGCPRALLHFLTVRCSLVGAVLLVSLHSAVGVSSSAVLALLLLGCGVNVALNLPEALQRSTDRWERRCFAGERRAGGEPLPAAARRELLGDPGTTRFLGGDDGRGEGTGFVAVAETHRAEIKELRRQWTLWKYRGDQGNADLGCWLARVHPVVRGLLGHRCWRSAPVHVAADLLRGLVGAELAKATLLLLLLSCNDKIGEAQLHVSAALAGACLVLLALILLSTEEIRRAAVAWGQWFEKLKLQALVGLHRATEALRNWRFYAHLTSFYCGLAARWLHAIVTANRRNTKPDDWRYPTTAPGFINSEVNLPVQQLHVVAPETGLLFHARAPQAPSVTSTAKTRFLSSVTSLLFPKASNATDYTPLTANGETIDVSSVSASVPLRKRLVRLGPVPQSHVEAQLPVQIDASSLLESLQGSAQSTCAGQLVATIQVVHRPSYRYPLYDKAFSPLSSFLAMAEPRYSRAWLRALNTTRHFSPSRAETDSYLSLYTDESLVPPSGRSLRGGLHLSQEEEERARTQAPEAALEKVAAVVRLEAWGGRRQLRILSDRIRLAHTYRVSPVEKRLPETSAAASAEEIDGEVAECLTSGRLEVTLPLGEKPDLRGDIHVVPQGALPAHFVITPDTVAVHYDESLNRVLLKHRQLQRGTRYATRFFSRRAMAPPPSARVQATEKGRLLVPLQGSALPDLDNFLLVLSPEEEPGVGLVVDPALTDAHICFVPALRPPPRSASVLGLSNDQGKSDAADHSGGDVSTLARSCTRMLFRALGGEEDEAAFLPPLPCTILAELSGDPDEEAESSGRSDEGLGNFRVEPNYKSQRLVFAAELNERDALLQDLLANGVAALPTVAEAVLSSSELTSFFADRGIHTNGESSWINPLTDTEHCAVREYSRELVHVKASLIDHLAACIDKEIRYFQMVVKDLETLEKMQNDAILRGAVQEHDEAIKMGKSLEELSFLNTRMERVRQDRYSPRFFRSVPFPLELAGSAIALKPRLADQMRKWEEQLGLWLTGEIGATTEDAPKGGPGRLEAAVDNILQQVYTCFYSRSPPMTHSRAAAASPSFASPSPPPVLHFVASSQTLCGGPSTWRPDPLPAHAAFVQLWERVEEEGEATERAVWIPCFLKLTASALQFVFPHFIARSLDSPARPERRFLPLQFVKLCDLSASAPSTLDSEHAWAVGAARSGKHEEDEFPHLRTQNLRMQFTTVEAHEASTTAENSSTRVLPADHLTLAGSAASRKFFFFSSKDATSLVSVRTSTRHLAMWQTMLVGAEMHKPKQLIEGYEGKVRFVLPAFASRRAPSGPYHLLFTSPEGELRARRGGALRRPRLFSSSPLLSPAFHKAPAAAHSAVAGGSRLPAPSHPYVALASGEEKLTAATRQERRQQSQYLGRQQDDAFHATSGTCRMQEGVEEESPSAATGEGHALLERPHSSLPLRAKHRRSDAPLSPSAGPAAPARPSTFAEGGGRGHAEQDARDKQPDAAGQWVREEAGEQNFYDPSTSPPQFLGRYVGEWSMSRYHGEGRLFDHRDRLAYDGTWANGRRWGQGVAYSQDANGTWWKQVGTFVDDELEGPVRLAVLEEADYDFDPSRAPCGASKSTVQILEIEGVVDAVHPGAEKPASATCLPAEAAWTSGPQPSITKEREAEYLPFLSRWGKLLGPTADPDSPSLWDRLNRSFTHIKFVDGSEFFRAMGRSALNGLIAGRLRTENFVYEGSFVDGRAEGRGKIRSIHSGAEYEGEWRSGLRHGKGVLRLPRPTPGTQIVIAATFKDGFASCSSGKIDLERASFCEDTKEIERRVEGDIVPFTSYVGGLHDGLPHGTGVMVFDSFIYEGDFFAGCREGKGVVKDIRKKGLIRVDGPWKDDVPHGRVSRVVYPDDSIFGGDFVHGKREGHGTLIRNNTVVYDGLWRDDVPDGRGTFVNEEGTYEGEIRKGKRHGKGRFTFLNETTDAGEFCFYEGDWDNDLPHGVGKLKGPSGKEGAFLFVRGRIDPSLKLRRADKGGSALELPPVGFSPSISPNPAWWKAGTSRLNRLHLKRTLDDGNTRFGDFYESQTFAFGVTPKGCPPRSKSGVALPVSFPDLLELDDDRGTPFVLQTPSGRRIS
ncbi:putative MORN repeat-containing protein [Neospora caninum Liverpool]|uniref:MORN repeat-containing protein, putative n=1 Tax=Neospora caninum (strain Liverpool) TaxID=572307 RepID=F0V8U1_NEOCL|nr:putative MORN repeat-containing protein [Neospora caninum Liverpool]CBZ50132.1 putative MORN repeat-containing protein [Neospora caninum Liverpool]CEL64726.1 TPA: MORN repeat-containing protein, putative [Neospora caninum Liverpool]|eukprot:XP_003880167.1 putative MORN repeat-containing protein [Neospora caninum Liverpool]